MNLRRKKMRTQALAFSVFITLLGFHLILFVSGGGGLEEKCMNELTKLVVCLSYVTGKATTPSYECCNTVKEIKSQDPVCLCYMIEQVHKGDATLKEMGVEESKLLQLPSACKLANANISDCPKLLNLPPNSTDNSIFMNSSSLASLSPPTAQSMPSHQKSDATFTGFGLGGTIVALSMVICTILTSMLCKIS